MFFSATKLPKVDKLTSFNPTSKKYWTNNQIVPGNQFSNVKASTKPPTCNRSKIYKRKFSPVQHLWETFSFDIILAAPLLISFATILGEIRSLHRVLQVLVNEPLTTTSIFSPEKVLISCYRNPSLCVHVPAKLNDFVRLDQLSRDYQYFDAGEHDNHEKR